MSAATGDNYVTVIPIVARMQQAGILSLPE